MSTARRRIVRRAVMALAGVVLLVSVYVASYGAALWLEGRGALGKKPGLSNAVMNRLHKTVFVPIHVGADWGVPLCHTIERFGVWCACRGLGLEVPWKDIHMN